MVWSRVFCRQVRVSAYFIILHIRIDWSRSDRSESHNRDCTIFFLPRFLSLESRGVPGRVSASASADFLEHLPPRMCRRVARPGHDCLQVHIDLLTGRLWLVPRPPSEARFGPPFENGGRAQPLCRIGAPRRASGAAGRAGHCVGPPATRAPRSPAPPPSGPVCAGGASRRPLIFGSDEPHWHRHNRGTAVVLPTCCTPFAVGVAGERADDWPDFAGPAGRVHLNFIITDRS
jgi:hypothetical protein